jgi:uncharacterized protein YciI
MKFLVLAYDATDSDASDRRKNAREGHLAVFKEFMTNQIFGAAILDDKEKIVGSVIICDFNSREEIVEQWFKKEPYILEKVWDRIEIKRLHE